MGRLSTALKSHLGNRNLIYAHLVKFELPTGAFLYWTDAAHDIMWSSNTYVAGKLLSVSQITETSKAAAHTISIALPGEIIDEVRRPLNIGPLDNNFINREVTIYKVFIDSTGSIVSSTDNPFELFRGLITASKVSEDPYKASKVTWTISSHWADFERVTGRLTDDEIHRGFGTSGSPELANCLYADYYYDKGFKWANRAINFEAQFKRPEERVRVKSSWFGFRTKVSNYTVWVNDTVDLNMNTFAKSLPVIYGVRKVEGIPVFADLQKADASSVAPERASYPSGSIGDASYQGAVALFNEQLDNRCSYVWVVYAICEGPVHSLLDVYIGGQPMICLNESDAEARGEDGGCVGRADSGSTLDLGHQDHVSLLDGKIDLTFFTGYGPSSSSGISGTQGYSSDLYATAISPGFVTQEYQGFTNQAGYGSTCGTGGNQPCAGDYWGPEFKMLDTAYAVCRFKIGSAAGGYDNIPDLSFVVKGMQVQTYNYLGTGTTGAYNTREFSINPSLQLLDYMRSKRYGRNIEIGNIDASSFVGTCGSGGTAGNCGGVANLVETIDNTYDSNWLPYWKWLGWPSQNNNYRYMHQTNMPIETDKSLFENINGILKQFNGILRFSGGQYSLKLATQEGSTFSFNIDNIIGAINVKEQGNKDKWNTISTSLSDPANKWSGKAITFYNSDYKVADNNKQKIGRVSLTGVTNYYTARGRIEQELKKSRYPVQINFKATPQALDTQVGEVIDITYDSFDWSSKLFRVTQLVVNPDCTIDITASEHTDDMYRISTSGSSGYPTASTTGSGNSTAPLAPSSLVYNAVSGGGICSCDSVAGTISSYASSGVSGRIAVTTANNHNRISGQNIVITNSSVSAYNGTYGIDAINGTRGFDITKTWSGTAATSGFWAAKTEYTQSTLCEQSGQISAIADAGGGRIRVITSTNHNRIVGSKINITGSTNYNGDNKQILNIPSSTTFDISGSFINNETGAWASAETWDGYVGIQGILSWNASGSSDISYYTITWVGTKSGESTPSVYGYITVDTLYHEVRDLPSGSYIFGVRAVNSAGLTSNEVTISTTINPATAMATVQNLKLLNPASGDNSEFLGSDPIITWDKAPEAYCIGYKVQVITPGGITQNYTNRAAGGTSGRNNIKFTYPLADNKTAYASANSGATGAYRNNIIFRVWAQGPASQISGSYAEL